MVTLIYYLARDHYNLGFWYRKVSFIVFTYRMYSPFNPLKRTINQCWTSPRKMTPVISLKHLRKRQEKCCQEVRRSIGFALFKRAFFIPVSPFVCAWYWICVRGNTFVVTGSKIFPLMPHLSFFYIINTWALIDKHWFQRMVLKRLGRSIYAHCKFSYLEGCMHVGVHAFETWPDAWMISWNPKLQPSNNYALHRVKRMIQS